MFDCYVYLSIVVTNAKSKSIQEVPQDTNNMRIIRETLGNMEKILRPTRRKSFRFAIYL